MGVNFWKTPHTVTILGYGIFTYIWLSFMVNDLVLRGWRFCIYPKYPCEFCIFTIYLPTN